MKLNTSVVVPILWPLLTLTLIRPPFSPAAAAAAADRVVVAPTDDPPPPLTTIRRRPIISTSSPAAEPLFAAYQTDSPDNSSTLSPSANSTTAGRPAAEDVVVDDNGATHGQPVGSEAASKELPNNVEISTQNGLIIPSGNEAPHDPTNLVRRSDSLSDVAMAPSNLANRRLLGSEVPAIGNDETHQRAMKIPATMMTTTAPSVTPARSGATVNTTIKTTEILGHPSGGKQHHTVSALGNVNTDNNNNRRDDNIMFAATTPRSTLAQTLASINRITTNAPFVHTANNKDDKYEVDYYATTAAAAKLLVNDSARFIIDTKTTARIDDSESTAVSFVMTTTTQSSSSSSKHEDKVMTGAAAPALMANGTAWPVKHSAVLEGDVILGGLMMVHSREDSITCGPIMPQGGVQALEVMLYTLDSINAMGLLPNVTVGAHILDDCDKDTYGLEMAVDFIKGE